MTPRRPALQVRQAPWWLVLCVAGASGCGAGFGGVVESRRVHAEAVGRDYQLQIYLPMGGGPPGERLPVVYQLDGVDQGASVAAFAQRDGHRLLVVAVTAADDVADSRFRDFTPTADATISRTTGEAQAFSRFLVEELVPLVDRSYPTDPGQRALMGHSLAGLFTAYQFFTQRADQPRFAFVACVSPSLWWNSDAIFDVEQRSIHDARWVPATLFLSSATLESADIVLSTTALASRLETDAAYGGLRWTRRTYPGSGHSWSWEKAYPDALSFFFGE